MSVIPFSGLLTWLVAGLVAGFAARLFPRRDLASLGRELGVALAGALLGGLLATFLDFGGMAVVDWRSVVVAALAGLAAVLPLRLLRD